LSALIESPQFPFIVFFFGACIGSFLNVLIYRLPLEIDFVSRHSFCPHCGHQIRFYENIPLFSYLFQWGKCRACKGQISIRYPIIELLVAGFSLWLYPFLALPDGVLKFILLLGIFSILLVHTLIDMKYQILPDLLNFALAVFGFLYSLFFSSLSLSLWGGLIGFVFPLLVAFFFYKLKGKEGLGGGDVKLYGALGLLLGPVLIVENIFLSSFLGSIVALAMILLKKLKSEVPIPFGPFITIVAFVQIYILQFKPLLMTITLE